MIDEEFIQQFIKGYTSCMLWSSVGSHPETEEDLENLEDYPLAEETKEKIEKDCRKWIKTNLLSLKAYALTYESEYQVWECAGHDYWLTRAGHGVGYWDRGLGKLGDRLTKACKKSGYVYAYLGDDLLIYLGE
jgi:hypothetical protein